MSTNYTQELTDTIRALTHSIAREIQADGVDIDYVLTALQQIRGLALDLEYSLATDEDRLVIEHNRAILKGAK